jgi:hypothetical protein
MVFISYTHDNEEHRRHVREFAALLQTAGISPVLDQWVGATRQDWYAWALREMTQADFVVVIASAGYRRMGDGYGPNDENLGGRVEAALLRDLLQHDREQWITKILPVILPGHSIAEIPDFLQPYAADHYQISSLTETGAENLLRAITHQPAHLRPPLGPLVNLPPRSGPGAAPQPRVPRWRSLSEPPPVTWRGGSNSGSFANWAATLELHLVPAAPSERIGIQKLEEAKAELIDVGRARGIFPDELAFLADYSGEGAWAHLADQRGRAAGLAIYRSGQRSCWFALHQARIGWIFDREVVTEQLSTRLAALMDLHFAMPPEVGFALAIEPAQLVRLGLTSEGAASSVSMPPARQDRIRIEPDDAVSADDLRDLTRPVAEELVARMVVVLK